MEESMESALARLRAKTDRELGVLVGRQLRRARKLAGRGARRDAAKDYLTARVLLTVADLPPAKRARLECLLHDVRKTIETPMSAVA
jgi:hypothetical protein